MESSEAASLLIAGIDEGHQGWLQDEQLMLLGHLVEFLEELVVRNVPHEALYFAQGPLCKIEDLFGLSIELWIQQLTLSLASLGSESDLDATLAFLSALHEGLSHSNWRLKEGLHVHANRLLHGPGLQEHQAFVVEFEADIEVFIFSKGLILEAGVE